MTRMHKLASATPPYERVPNILRYTFNNLFITVHSQYLGIKKPLGGFSHYINIGVLLF